MASIKRYHLTYLKNILFPCVVFSVVTGVLTGGVIFLFRKAASLVAGFSAEAYRFVGEHPQWIPVLILSVCGLGVLSWLLLKLVPDARGGGIPNSVGLIRGLLTFRWLRCLLGVAFSSMLTFLGGVPLGTEGPSVQMGAAVGRGCIRILGRNHPAWDRYVMTGGAGAGFAAATGAPLTGILFAFEEAHQRFSPMIFMVASMTAVSGSLTTKYLFSVTGSSWDMFSFSMNTALPLSRWWVPLVIGAVCGLVAVIFTKIYGQVGYLLEKTKKIPSVFKFCAVFLAVAAVGIVLPSVTGSGHDLIEELMEKGSVWWILLLLLVLRALFLIVANQGGITGGLFVPSLTFGAILGALCGTALVGIGLLPSEYFPVTVVLGMTAFLGASARTPLMAVAFGIEALSGISNGLPIVLAVSVAYVVIEIFGIEGFMEAVLSKKISAARKGKTEQTMELEFTVRPDSFVVGKEIRDVLWPPACLVLSVDRNPFAARGSHGIGEGDVLHLHCRSYDPEETVRLLEDLVGVQDRSDP